MSRTGKMCQGDKGQEEGMTVLLAPQSPELIIIKTLQQDFHYIEVGHYMLSE